MTRLSFQNLKGVWVNRSMTLVAVSLFMISAVALNQHGFNLWSGTSNENAAESAMTGRVSVFKEVAKPVYLPPIEVHFKEKTLPVEEINVEEGGFLGVPSSWQTAGWYKDGAKPGEGGNVLIDGHYDTNTGAPGAFWGLKDLRLGDKVLLTDKLGRVFGYSVSTKSYISINDPARSQVFASGKDKILTLITCGGVWDYGSGTYNKRLVITAIFDKMEKSW